MEDDISLRGVRDSVNDGGESGKFGRVTIEAGSSEECRVASEDNEGDLEDEGGDLIGVVKSVRVDDRGDLEGGGLVVMEVAVIIFMVVVAMRMLVVVDVVSVVEVIVLPVVVEVVIMMVEVVSTAVFIFVAVVTVVVGVSQSM